MLLVRRGTPLMWHGCDGFSFFLRRCWLGQHHFVPVTSPASLAWRSRGRAATSSCQRRWRLRASGPRERQRRLQGSAAGGPKAPWCAPWRRHGASRRQGREVPWRRRNFFSFLCFPPSPASFFSSRFTLFLRILAAATWDGEETVAAVGFIAQALGSAAGCCWHGRPVILGVRAPDTRRHPRGCAMV
jgi:hypothetical protein